MSCNFCLCLDNAILICITCMSVKQVDAEDEEEDDKEDSPAPADSVSSTCNL